VGHSTKFMPDKNGLGANVLVALLTKIMPSVNGARRSSV
jgi:hypothetical protein